MASTNPKEKIDLIEEQIKKLKEKNKDFKLKQKENLVVFYLNLGMQKNWILI
nr:hypothetical protein P5648_22130 [Bacillus subtilis]WGD74630.1 hypothetical protein P5631_00240 [Bacillus subtilis]